MNEDKKEALNIKVALFPHTLWFEAFPCFSSEDDDSKGLPARKDDGEGLTNIVSGPFDI